MSGTPTTSTSTPRTRAAAAAPSRAERQPRLTPAATTMVRASTISTRLAANTAMIRTSVEEVCIPPQKLPAAPPCPRPRASAVVCGSLTRSSASGALCPVSGSSVRVQGGRCMGEGAATGAQGRNYVVVSADTHASPDSLDHFLSYVDPAHREAVAAFGDMSSLAISMFGGFDPGEVDESDPVRATAARRLAGMGVDIAAAEGWLAHYGTDWVVPGDGDGRRLAVLEEQGIHAEVTLPGPILAGGLSPAMYLGSRTSKGLDVLWPALHAYNRWLADFCSAAPGRRAGCIPIDLHDMDRAVE